MQNRSSASPFPAIYTEADVLDENLQSFSAAAFELKIYDVTFLHYHSTMELGWCVSGSGECYVEDRVFPFSAGDIQIIFPYQKHYNRSAPGSPSRWHFVNINPTTLLPALGFLSPPAVEEWLQNEMALFGVFSREEHCSIHEPAARFFREFLRSDGEQARRPELCGALLCELFCALSRGSAALPKLTLRQNSVLTQVSPALRHIQHRLSQGVSPTVSSLAALCSMSEPNFRRVFRRATGSAPKEYILHAAVHRAEQLLLSTDDEIVRIAAESGFADVSGLNRQFLRKNGVSPSRFRLLHRR